MDINCGWSLVSATDKYQRICMQYKDKRGMLRTEMSPIFPKGELHKHYQILGDWFYFDVIPKYRILCKN